MKQITAQQTVNLLNDMLKIDPDAVARLMTKCRCNQKIGMHAAIPVGLDDNNRFSLNMIDVLNGVFGAGANHQPTIQVVHAATCENEHPVLEATKYDHCKECGKMPDLHEILRFKVNE